jgi:hypothetical protein
VFLQGSRTPIDRSSEAQGGLEWSYRCLRLT